MPKVLNEKKYKGVCLLFYNPLTCMTAQPNAVIINS
jgi:hypothetical protein